MRRILIAFLVAGTAGLFMWAATTAAADVNDPGSGCNDQVNGASCVPDPSDEGQDCLPHGQNEDGNENHCLPTTTTTVIPTTTVTTTATTPPPTTTTTVSETPSPTPTESSPPPTETSTSTHVPKPHSQPPTTGDGPKGTPNGPGKLAFTGVEDVVPIGAGALLLAALGTGLMWAGTRRSAGKAGRRDS